MRIALVVDNPYRDLPGLVLLAWRLCRSGATCYLVPVNLRNIELWHLAPDFVLFSYFRPANQELARQLMEADIRVGVLDSEGSIFSSVPPSAVTSPDAASSRLSDTPDALEEYAISMAPDRNIRHQIACFCAWSPAFANYAIKAGWYRSEQVAVTGSPRFDFHAERWRETSRQLSKYADKYLSPLVLINSSFTLANPRFHSPEREQEMLVSSYSYDRRFTEKWRRTQSEALEGLASLANHVAAEIPGATFIFRPHPFENDDTYRSLLQRLPNLHLVKQGTVDGWLLRAKALIHWGSSTAVDASLYGIPAFTAAWIPEHLPVPIVDDLSVRCTTLDGLTEKLNATLEDRYTQPEEIQSSLQQVISNSLYRIDGCAHDRVADAILKATGGRRSSVAIKKCRERAFGMGRAGQPLKSRLAARVRFSLGLSSNWPFRRRQELSPDTLPWDSSEKQYSASDAQRIVSTVETVAQETSRSLKVVPAQEASAYQFGYTRGRSVAVYQQ